MNLTLGQAAKEAGKSKATISKYLKNGKLSYVSKTEKGYQIDPSELFRVFPKNEQETVHNEQPQTHKITPANSILQKEVDLLRERLDDKEDVIKDLRERLDKESDERRKLTNLLTDDRQKSPEKPAEKKKGFWGSLFG